jgi:GntR family transcriptional regulator, transcriptional repressor for pyruvate dehydrogenase complex
MNTTRTSHRTKKNGTAARNATRTARQPASIKSLQSIRLRRSTAEKPSPSLVQQAVEALRKKILSSSQPNQFLGSEDQLLAALGVSRPTFRQAARLLEHEQLLKIKRGIGGGFFAQAPSAMVVSRLASIFLNAQGTTLLQLNDAIVPILIEAVRLLARHPDPARRGQLLEFVRSHAGFEDSDDEKLHAKVVLEFEQLIGSLCGNPALELMINVMRDLVRNPRYGYFRIDRQRARVYSEFSKRISQAVLDGDSDMAVLIFNRHVADIRSWLPEGSG